MRLRFHRSIRILPGIRLNLNRRSSSITVGGHGVHETFGSKGIRTTIGIPGTALSASQFEPHRHAPVTPRPSTVGAIGTLLVVGPVLAAVFAVAFFIIGPAINR